MGTPIPGTGRKSPAALRSKKLPGGRGGCVSAGSHVISHRYADEGETGGPMRRLVRRRETRMWKRDID
jgi:hypothetical protein